jgi:nucleoside-diphosphate-sugar epimerase
LSIGLEQGWCKERLVLKVLVTGVCGNIGSTLATRLIQEKYEVRGFDLPTDGNKQVAAGLGKAEMVWGDITDAESVTKAIDNDVDTIVHLAFILPPMSEEKPQVAEKVNVYGTKNVIEATKASSRKPKLIFTSSVSIFGITADEKPPIKPDHPVKATDNYTRHKIVCEEMIRGSRLTYTILRLAVAPPIGLGSETMALVHSLPPEGRMEFLHVQDACTALVNSIKQKESNNRTFVIAGGKRNQMLYRDLLGKTFVVLGLSMPDWSEFGKKPYYTDWYDTRESQAVLKYQTRKLEDYIKDFKKKLGMP